MLIYYPTPQLAAEHLRRIDAAHKSKPGESSVENVGEYYAKRSGPIVAIAAGSISESDAKALLGRVNWEANVTWNENTYLSKKDNLANLLFNVIVLCGIVVGVSLVAGLAFGGLRILMKRIFPDRVFDRPDDMEIISLHLGDTLEQASRRR